MTIGLGHLGWSTADFWDASLDELLLAWRGHLEREDHADFRAGLLAALYCESKRDPDKNSEPYSPGFWFPRLRPPAEEDEEEMSSSEMVDRHIAEFMRASENTQPDPVQPTKEESEPEPEYK